MVGIFYFADKRKEINNMFVDELTIYAKAGRGGNGVVRWLRERHRPLGGPAGGNGGKGGDVYIRAVRDLALLSKYTGEKKFVAENGEPGHEKSRHGKDGKDYTLDIPIGSIVTDIGRELRYELRVEGQTEKILRGGSGGLGNEYFKSSTNTSPKESTSGKVGEEGTFLIELELLVDVGIIGLPNAGKSTLLNAMTNAHSRVDSYPFTTLEPHLGDLRGHIIADIPGLIEGASSGKGLGYKFLRHIKRTKMLLHCVSTEHDDVVQAYRTVRKEMKDYDTEIIKKSEIIVLTKTDLNDSVDENLAKLAKCGKVFPVSKDKPEGIKELADHLVRTLRGREDSATIE